MNYTIYKTTNIINGKIYIGKHKTNNLSDKYLGSGKMLSTAIKKHGRENFIKEVLFIFNNEQEMNVKEAELVTEAFCLREDTYNLCIGGFGGWNYSNKNALSSFWKNKNHTTEHKSKVSKALLGRNLSNEHKENIRLSMIDNSAWNKNKSLSNSHKNKISESMKNKQIGPKNSQFGTMWITNGLENKKIKNSDIIPEGWNKGLNKSLFKRK